MIVFINYLATICLILWVILSRNPQRTFAPLFMSAFSGIPIYYFGRSSSGGIFPVDIIAVTIILRFGFKYGKSFVKTVTERKLLLLLIILTLWATFSSVYAITQTDYGDRYLRFLLYGVGRWWTFAGFAIIFLGYQFNEDIFSNISRKLYFAFLIYGIILIFHQQGFIELSGIEGLGPRIKETMKDILNEYEFKSMFWGNNRANVGAICYTGFWFAILCWLNSKEQKWRRNSLILATIMVGGLIGSWSRSDFAALIISFIFWIVITNKGVSLRTQKLGVIVAFIVFNVWAIFTILDIQVKSETLERYSVFLENKWQEEGTGKYRTEMHKSLIEHLINNEEILLTGIGANGFRSLYGEGGIWSNAAHNTFLHILTELGLIGILLTFLLIYKIIAYPKKILRKCDDYLLKNVLFPILMSFIFGRLVAGYAVDTLFAVDVMLPSTLMFFGFVGFLISKKCL